MSQNEARSFHGGFVPFHRLCRWNVGRKCGWQLPFGNGAVMSAANAYVVEFHDGNDWCIYGWYSTLKAANETMIAKMIAEKDIAIVWTLRKA